MSKSLRRVAAAAAGAALLTAGCTSSSSIDDQFVADLDAFRAGEPQPTDPAPGGQPDRRLPGGKVDAAPETTGDLTTLDPEVQAARVALFCQEYVTYQKMEDQLLSGGGGATPLNVRFQQLGAQAIAMQVALGPAGSSNIDGALQRFTAGLLLGSNPVEPAMLREATVIDGYVAQNCTPA